jgi:replicative DNA helicase
MNHEHAVLGAALLEPSLVPIICGELIAEDFYTPQAATVFTAVDSLFKAESPIDLATLTAELERTGELERVGGITYLCDLIAYTPTTANTRAYIELLHDSRRRRTFERGMREAVEQAETGNEGYIAKANDTMDAVNMIGASGVETVIDIMPTVLNRLGDTSRGISTGFHMLDYITGGFGKGHLIVIAARPAIGKTSFACNIAANMARAGLVIPFFSIEMSKEEITERVMLSEAQVDKYAAMQSTKAMQAVIDIGDKIKDWKLFVDDRGSLSAGQVISTSYKVKQLSGKLDCVFIDYLQLMQMDKNENRNQAVGAMTRQLKQMAKEIKCPVVVLSQLNRAADGRRPTVADLRDSGEIEQNADMVILLHREKDTDTQTVAIVGKNRHGKTGDIDFVWHPEYTRFMEPPMKNVQIPKGVFDK